MALVTISGYPCSGKTTRALEIKKGLEERINQSDYNGPIRSVVIISDDTLNLTRKAYDDSRTEKPQRGALFTALQRQIAKNTIVIVDALNYIKGFRYQMYCVARETGVRVATIFVVSTPELCHLWHEGRPEELAYAKPTFENLLQRFEEPSSMVRWDSPLFTIPWNEESAPMDELWLSLTAGVLKPPNAGTSGAPKPPSDALQALEQTSLGIVSTIMSAQGMNSGGSVTVWKSGNQQAVVEMPSRHVTLAELQRLKRQFVTMHKKAITQGATEAGDVDWSEEAIATKFSHYIEERLKGD